MKKYIAFLRAINVGGHNVKMDYLKSLFEEIGFSNVETFIASGNVIFETSKKDRKKIEEEIEKHLFKSLGYEVVTFIRTFAELEEVNKYQAFSKSKYEKAKANCVGFIKNPLNKDSLKILNNFATEIDEFNSQKTEVYWICEKGQSESTFSGNLFERKLKTKVTFRGVKTLQKLGNKYYKKM
jgi:uncharacterized protein (DUF1697 family)